MVISASLIFAVILFVQRLGGKEKVIKNNNIATNKKRKSLHPCSTISPYLASLKIHAAACKRWGLLRSEIHLAQENCIGNTRGFGEAGKSPVQTTTASSQHSRSSAKRQPQQRGTQTECSKSAHAGEKTRVRFSGTKPAEPAPSVRGSSPWNTAFFSTRLGLHRRAAQFPLQQAPCRAENRSLLKPSSGIACSVSYPRTEVLAMVQWHTRD